MDEFVVDPSYPGHIYVGNAQGRFDADTPQGKEKRPYYNMYVISPVSSYKSEDYEGFGFKAEKLPCVSPEVWKDLKPGDRIRILNDGKRVAMVILDQ